MEDKKVNFFAKLKTAEHRNFEITMFVISVLIAIVLLACVVILGVYWGKGASDKIADDGEDIVSSAAVTVTEEPSEATSTPSSLIMPDDDDLGIDEDLKPGSRAYTTAYVNMRSEASLTAAVVTKVPSGARVKIVKLEKKEWFEVTYDGVSGYINAMYLSSKKPAPVATSTPSVTQPPRTAEPTKRPTAKPTKKPPKRTKRPGVTKTPRPQITDEPTSEPTMAPTEKPTAAPTEKPTMAPTEPPQESSNPAAE